MSRKIPDQLKNLSFDLEKIRNVCLVAHVDHGKTTLADCLLVSNQIISKKLAGQLRLMDNLEEEQLRGITMKSSAASLLFYPPTDNDSTSPYLINFIDSPGHIDFCNEVSAAVRLSDGAIFIVDVVEGVCPQTRAVLSQAWNEKVKPLLVINKMDRLIVELCLTPDEAYSHILRIIEQVNSVLAELHLSQTIDKEDNEKKADKEKDDDDENLYFRPENGNVVFASARDNWAFRVNEFASTYARKLACREEILKKTLWGDYYFNGKDKKIKNGAFEKQKETMFVKFVLKPLWSLYEAIVNNSDKLSSMLQSLNLMQLSARELNQKDRTVLLKTIMSEWLPLAKCICIALIDILPSPGHLDEEKLKCLFQQQSISSSSINSNNNQQLTTSITNCLTNLANCSRQPDAPVMAFIAKFVTDQSHQEFFQSFAVVDSQSVKKETSDDYLVCFIRIYSGCIRPGQKLFLLGPKYRPNKSVSLSSVRADDCVCGAYACVKHVFVVCVESIFYFWGREFLTVNKEIPAGHIVGVRLSFHNPNPTSSSSIRPLFKTATLSDRLLIPSFAPLSMVCDPIVCVALEPIDVSQLTQLENGLLHLEQMDPTVRIHLPSNGQLLLYTAGEVHLEKCLDDLRKRIIPHVQFTKSPFIVPFRETITLPSLQQSSLTTTTTTTSTATSTVVNSNIVISTTFLPVGQLKISLQALPIPLRIQHFLDSNVPQLVSLTSGGSGGNHNASQQQFLTSLHTLITNFDTEDLLEDDILLHRNFLRALKQKNDPLQQENLSLEQLAHYLWAFGPFSSENVSQYKQDVVAGGGGVGGEENNQAGGNKEEDEMIYRNISGTTTTASYATGGTCNLLFSHLDLTNEKSPFYSFIFSSSLPFSTSSKQQHHHRFKHLPNYSLACVHGFHLVCHSGPLCGEPLRGVAFLLENITLISSTINEGNNNDVDEANDLTNPIVLDDAIVLESNNQTANDNADDNGNDNASTPASSQQSSDGGSRGGRNWWTNSSRSFPCSPGQLTAAIRKACTFAFQASPQQRLMLAMYQLDAQVREDVIGKLHAVLARRHANIFYQDLLAGTATFLIRCHVPVVESFGLCDELRKRTSGLALPQMRWSHWELLDGDPTTDPPLSGLNDDDDNEDNDENNDNNKQRKDDNVLHQRGSYTDWLRAVRYCTDVRKQKGMSVRQQIVAFAEKQRNLSKKK